MTYEEFLKGTDPTWNDSIEDIRKVCYELHELQITDSTNYQSFNTHEGRGKSPLSAVIRDSLDYIS